MVLRAQQSPPETPQSDLSFTIDFDQTKGSVSRVFAATHHFIVGCERLDQELVRCLDSNIHSVMTIGDIEAGSLKTFLVQVIQGADDDTIRREGWRAFARSFLIEAKHVILRRVDGRDGGWQPKEIMGDINRMALDKQVLEFPHYRPPRLKKIIEAVADYGRMKDELVDGDTAYMESNYGRHDVDLSVRTDADTLMELATAMRRESVSPMVMVVKKPDFLGDSQWELRHGGRVVRAKIEDEDWLWDFQQRGVGLQPGDALDCLVRVVNSYGYDNELLATKHYIQSVTGVILQEAPAKSLL